MGTLDYYTALMRVAPGAVARSAVRRVQGVARQALYRRRDRFDEEHLRVAFGASTAEELVERALGGRAPVWCDVSQRAAAREALAAVPGAKGRALERAREALHQRFDVFGTRVSFGEGRPVDWATDPASGHVYNVVPVESLSLLKAGADPKYPWVLGRLDSAVALGQGYWASNAAEERSRFAQAFVVQTLDFLQANPVGHGVQWACPWRWPCARRTWPRRS